MAAFTVPYMIPLFLGMTYNAYTNKPGVDIFTKECVNNPVVTDFKNTESRYKVVNSLSDVKSVLDVSGDLAVQIKSGMINVEGKGSYLKNVRDLMNKVEILLRITYVSKVDSFKQDCKPREGWLDSFSTKVLGTHYVSQVTYGAEMIASLRFEVFNSSDVQEVKGAVNLAFGSGGSGLNLTAEGKLENLQKNVEGKANLRISYYGTVPLKSIPNNIEGFRELVTNFGSQIKENNLEDGLPMQVQLTSLASVADADHQDQFDFLKNAVLENRMSDFGNMLDELRTSRLNLTSWAKALPFHLESEHEKEVGRLIKNITQVLEVFYDTIWKLDPTKGPEQLKPALDAYDYDGKSVFNRYSKLVKRLIQKLDPQIKRDEVAADTYIQWGNSNCTAPNTQVLYNGFVISSTEEGIGGMSQYDCAPKTPEKGYEVKDGQVLSHLAGIRYTKIEKAVNPFKGSNAKKVSEKGVTCAKCYSPDSASVVMFSATESCPLTWEKMYTGYLMSARLGGHTTQYVCVDDTPAAGYEMEHRESSRDTMAFTVVRSEGSLPKETYINNAFIRCAVCAMKSNQISL